MRPEEWYTKVENSINAVIAVQAQHEVEIRELVAVSFTQAQNLGILAENIGVLVHKVDTLSDIVRDHEGKIDALIDTVDRIVRHGERPS
jgi:hypothetical protein